MKKNFFVISKTPLRISLFGGGTDFPYFFKKKLSNVINFTIDKFCYVTIKDHHIQPFSERFRLNYSEVENIESIYKIKNKIIKNTLLKKKMNYPLYISVISDIPAGTGMGSSSSFCVGLLNCLNDIKEKPNKKFYNALEATNIEINMCKEPIGFQDQFAASYGGFNHFIFNKKNFKVNNLVKYNKYLQLIIDRSVLLWTGVSRSASKILKDQKKNLNNNYSNLEKMNNLSLEFLNILENFSYKNFISLMNKNTELKYSLSNMIFNKEYEKLIKNDKKIIASKILGAGGGGFILCFFKDKKNKNLFLKENRNALKYDFYKQGSKIIKNI